MPPEPTVEATQTALQNVASYATIVEAIATVLGTIIALFILCLTLKQIKQSTDVSRGQFWLELEKMFTSHDEVHMKLRPDGEWSKNLEGPVKPEDWVKVDDYMGLFEHCEIMIRKGLIDEQTFKDIFSYRLDNLLHNSVIVRKKLLGEERNKWGNFLRLIQHLDMKIPQPGNDSSE